jgi:hypothetical protein
MGILRELEELMTHVLSAILPKYYGQETAEDVNRRQDNW